MRADVAIIGGGIMGAALAHWLMRLQPGLSVTVIERDPSYATASSALSAASIRQQYSTAINIRISRASIAMLREVGELLEVSGDRPDIGLVEAGYLYVADEAGAAGLRRAHEFQLRHGADVALLDRAALASRFPWLETQDLAAGTLGLSGEGWFDGYLLLGAFARKARSLGASFLRGEAVGMDVQKGRVTRVRLADGSRIDCAYVVNAAGPWARAVAAQAGIDLPVRARRRTVYVIGCRTPMQPFPLLIDTTGFWMRPEGRGYIAGFSPADDPDDAPLEPVYEDFEAILWPALAARVPALEAAKLERAWAGYYEMNTFDHNGVVGFHPEVENFGFMNGFSGHGIQQGPVVGRGMAELILRGRYLSLDLSELGFQRILDGQPLEEMNVIG